VHATRGALDRSGQRLAATERLYLITEVPALLIAGGHDPVIPVAHTTDAHDLLPASRLEVFELAGHFPHVDDPVRFAHVLHDFVATTTADQASLKTLRRRLLSAGKPVAAGLRSVYR
jgi:pimeloyl-ACP methyl ester carboxylesterase